MGESWASYAWSGKRCGGACETRPPRAQALTLKHCGSKYVLRRPELQNTVPGGMLYLPNSVVLPQMRELTALRSWALDAMMSSLRMGRQMGSKGLRVS